MKLEQNVRLIYVNLYFCLPSSKFLDGREITRSERTQAVQNYPEVAKRIQEQEQAYLLKRAREREEAELKKLEKWKKEEMEMDDHLGFDIQQSTGVNPKMYVHGPPFLFPCHLDTFFCLGKKNVFGLYSVLHEDLITFHIAGAQWYSTCLRFCRVASC